MSVSNAGVVNIVNAAGLEVFCGLAPRKGPKALRFDCDLSIYNSTLANGAQIIDLEDPISKDKIEFVQSVYIDNSLNAAPLILTCGITNQSIQCPANAQGYFSVLAPNPAKFTAASTTTNLVIPIFFLNFPVAALVWKVA